MTNTEINIAIAEAVGFTHIELGPYDGHPFGIGPGETNPLTQVRCPNYCVSLNAMHDAINSLSIEQRMDWLVKLDNIVLRDNPKDVAWYPLRLLNATARQRAEAFLRTLGKFKE